MNDNQLIFEAFNRIYLDGMITDDAGNQRYYKNGELHRDDGPAYVGVDGSEEWFKDGNTHRDGGPAITNSTGSKAWYQNGRLHREDGPAYIPTKGKPVFYFNAKSCDVNYWAKLVLMKNDKPHDPAAVQEFVRHVLAKQTKDLI